MALLRQTYEGTQWDVTRNLKVVKKDRKTGQTDTIISPKANPWMRPDEVQMLNGIKEGAVKSYRNIAVPQCAYSTVIQLRSWLPDAVGGICWFSMDNPGQSPRVPILQELPTCLPCIKFVAITVTAKMQPYGITAVPINWQPYAGETHAALWKKHPAL